MIPIDRSGSKVPPDLVTDGEAHLKDIRRLVKKKKLRSKHFDAAMYGAREVRKELHSAQRGKCCYCEKLIESVLAHVDHYRPKARVTKVNAGGKRVRDRDGYWWLAYVFDNLLLACPNCNNAKSDLFPLEPKTNALAPEMLPAAGSERPLLIDPGHEDPSAHIDFAFDPLKRLVPTGTTERGRETMRTLALDRDDLVEIRRTYYRAAIEPLLVHWRDIPAERPRWRAEAEALVREDREFSAMARAAFRLAGIL